MKKTLIALATLQCAAALAANVKAHAKDRVISLVPNAENDDAIWLKSTETIITHEMQADKKPRYIKKIRGRGDLNPVILADVRPIHIGGGCSDHGGGSGGITKCDYGPNVCLRTSRSRSTASRARPRKLRPTDLPWSDPPPNLAFGRPAHWCGLFLCLNHTF